MFERFTDAAKRVVVLAQEEARLLGHDYIGTEHLWLGLIHEGDGVAGQVLEALDVSLEPAREGVEEAVGRGPGPVTGQVPFTPEAKRVLERSWYQARDLGVRHIDTEEILLALLECGGVGREIMKSAGVTQEAVMPELTRLMRDTRSSEGGWVGYRPDEGQDEPDPIVEPACPVCRRALSETAATARIDVPGPAEGDPAISVSVVFCTACGSSIGVVP